MDRPTHYGEPIQALRDASTLLEYASQHKSWFSLRNQQKLRMAMSLIHSVREEVDIEFAAEYMKYISTANT